MRWVQRLRLRLRSLRHRRQVDQELDEELRFHLEQLIEQNLAAGLPADEARHAALREMGGLEQRKEECRDTRGWRWLDELTWDVRLALRGFRRSPLFAAVAVGSLALGIGVNTALFSAVNGLLLRPLPYPHSDRLVHIGQEGGFGAVLGVFFIDWRAHSRTLEVIAGYDTTDVVLRGVGDPERQRGVQVSDAFFPALGASMTLGRAFLPSELSPDGERVVVLSHDLWQRRFGADPAVIGRTIGLDHHEHRVVGVMSPEVRFVEHADLWLPLALDERRERNATGPWRFVHTFARLRPGATAEQAAAELQVIKNVYTNGAPDLVAGRVRITPLQDQLAGGTRRLLLILLGAVVLILAIACANVANVMLARAASRQKNRAMLAALGASRFRLVRQMLAESLLLAMAGGLGGLVFASGLTRLVLELGPPGMFGPLARVATFSLDGRVLGFTLAASVASALFFGSVPALQFSRPDLTRSLKDGRSSAFSARQPLRQVLLVAQVALSMVLLIGAGLLIRSFVKTMQVAPGFRTENLLTVRLELDPDRYSEHGPRARFAQQLLESVAVLPGVEAAGAITNLPLTTAGETTLSLPLGDGSGDKRKVHVTVAMVSPAYFEAAGITVYAGRAFDARDTAGAAPVVILSRALAQLLFKDRDPIGQPHPWGTVVGVVGDVRHRGLDKDVRPALYRPYQQDSLGRLTLVVRSAQSTEALAATVRRQVLAVDPDQATSEVKTMEQHVAASLGPRRFTMLLLGALALLALLLASMGVYSVIAYAVTQRTHEVGIRVALGAARADVLGLFLKQGLILGALGIAVGGFAALGLARVLTGWLFGIHANDPATFVAAPAALALMVLAATALPAWRATRVAALTALRHE